MTQPPEEMACRTCLRVLNTSGDPAVYVHPDGHGPVTDHRPDPVPTRNLDTVHRRCDFCGDPHPLWSLHGGDLTSIAHGADTTLVNRYGDRWAACATCHTLIEDGKIDHLSRHAAGALGIASPGAFRHVAEFHRGFLERLDQDRTVLLTTTAWPATAIDPRTIPKIRDRLGRLYRYPRLLPSTFRAAAPAIADGLDRGHLIWIDGEFTDLTDGACARLPDVTISRDLLPADDGLLVWSRPIGAQHATAASWTRTRTGWDIVCYRTIGEGLHGTPLQRVREQIGWLVPMSVRSVVDDQTIGGAAEPTAALATTWLLIAQELAELRSSTASKAVRGTYARAGRPAPEVTIVSIRRRAARTQSRADTHGASRPPLMERVWVTPHWRNVAYGPRRALRRPRWIDPFLRGPADSPIKASTTVRVLGSGRPQPPPPVGGK
ncbi:hypothetical protein AB0J82_21045 [Asanoa sp. NPDC049518]|uniref:hypothetical protein n=1 Tax=unclassified Asanoa TaxID=2685164 RepID=UPI0034406F8D